MIFSLNMIAVGMLSILSADSTATRLPVTADTTFLVQKRYSDSLLEFKIFPASIRKEESAETRIAKNTDSIPNKIIQDTSEFIPVEEFTFAGKRRYILD